MRKIFCLRFKKKLTLWHLLGCDMGAPLLGLVGLVVPFVVTAVRVLMGCVLSLQSFSQCHCWYGARQLSPNEPTSPPPASPGEGHSNLAGHPLLPFPAPVPAAPTACPPASRLHSSCDTPWRWIGGVLARSRSGSAAGRFELPSGLAVLSRADPGGIDYGCRAGDAT